MKKTLFASLAGSFFALAVTATTFAQNSNSLFSPNVKNPIPEYRELSNGNAANSDPVVSSKVLNTFAGMFKNAVDVRWYEVDQKFLAKFKQNGRETNALFDTKGTMLYTISYGNEKHLPADVRRLVRSNYFDYEVIYTAEVNSLAKIAWVVKLEDSNSIIIVKIFDGEMEETENYRKSK